MSDIEDFPNVSEGSSEPIHIQDALKEEVDRLIVKSQEFYNEKDRQQEDGEKELARRRPELYEIEEEIGELRKKEKLNEEETARLAELRIRYDALILGNKGSKA